VFLTTGFVPEMKGGDGDYIHAADQGEIDLILCGHIDRAKKTDADHIKFGDESTFAKLRGATEVTSGINITPFMP
jgi:hypothetical protein